MRSRSAATIRVAHYQGLEEPENSKKSGLGALKLSALYGLIMTGLVFAFREQIVTLFSQDKEVIALISGLVLYIAVFQFVDAIQIVAAGILRGLEEFIKPLIAVLCTYWVVVIPLSYFIGIRGWWIAKPGIYTIWTLLSLGLACAAIVLGSQAYIQLSAKLKTSNYTAQQAS